MGFQVWILSVFVLIAATQVSEGVGMSCEAALGISINCPLPFQSNDKAFCCYQNSNTPYCCDLEDYFVNNTAIIGGVIVAAIVLLLAIILCCCCCCSCCFLAKRRQQRHTILYGRVATTFPAATSHPVQPVHSAYMASAYQQTPIIHSPPPYPNNQPPFNPSFGQ